MPPRIFLLSPANLGGIRAQQFLSPRSKAEAALQFRTPEGVEIGDAFTYMSGLYFRGKLAYARQFGCAPDGDECGVYVIAPGFGLVPDGWRIDQERMKVLRRTDVDLKDRRYVKTMRATCGELASRLDADVEVVLLGSVASGKYVDLLRPAFGERLRFPAAFAGLGDMARGGLLLRAVRADRELEYTTLDARRHRAPGGSGKMPTEW